MDRNFDILLERVIDTLNKSDLLAIKEQLDNIHGNSILVGSGGSSVVATFASKIIANSFTSGYRDLFYMNLNNIDNIILFSYSGLGYNMDSLLGFNKKLYLFTNGCPNYFNVENIRYDSSISKEKSFISLASTLMPMVLLYYYNVYGFYLQKSMFENTIKNMFEKAKNVNIEHNNVYEILTGYDTLSASIYLESTMVESGIAIPIVHDKYNYCHGRTTTSYKSNNGLILFDSGKELDKLYLEILKDYYTEIVRIERFHNDDNQIENDFYATIKAMYLTKKLAENKSRDLSNVDYSPVVKKIYRYNGKM